MLSDALSELILTFGVRVPDDRVSLYLRRLSVFAEADAVAACVRAANTLDRFPSLSALLSLAAECERERTGNAQGWYTFRKSDIPGMADFADADNNPYRVRKEP